ncbi:MAG TPA: type II secretion system protein [Acidimicrobiia bacterium]
MTFPRPSGDPEGGFTLSEALVALIILGVAITAIVTAMGASITASDIHQKIVTDDAILQSYSERLNAAPYVTCATASTAPYGPAGVNLDLANWPGYSASLVKVEYWNGSTPIGFSDTCTTDFGLQRITIEANSSEQLAPGHPRGGHRQLQILKRLP